MAQLNRETIKALSGLCRIHCTEEDEESLLKDLGKILEYVEQLGKIDTTDIAPCNHVLESMINVEREDIVGETLPREEFLANAPESISGMIRVPPVIKNR